MSQIEDINAINQYLTTANANTPAALTVQMNWKNYFNSLSWLEKSVDADTFAKAKRYRDDFNTANTGITPPGSAPKPTQKLLIKQGSSGPNVVEWQRIIGVAADGKFGPGTKAKTIEWQRNHGLSADGIVGQQTWAKALEPNIFKIVAAAPSTVNPTPRPVVPPAVIREVTYTPAEQYNIPSPPKSGTNPQVAKPKPTAKPIAKSSSASSGSSILKQGSTGAAVVNWQKKIGVKPDGVFGPATKSATIIWQKAHGLNPDGMVGPDTIAASMVVANTPINNTGQAINSAGKALDAATNAVTAAPKAITKAVNKLPLWLQITMGSASAGLVFLGFRGLTKR